MRGGPRQWLVLDKWNARSWQFCTIGLKNFPVIAEIPRLVCSTTNDLQGERDCYEQALEFRDCLRIGPFRVRTSAAKPGRRCVFGEADHTQRRHPDAPGRDDCHAGRKWRLCASQWRLRQPRCGRRIAVAERGALRTECYRLCLPLNAGGATSTCDPRLARGS